MDGQTIVFALTFVVSFGLYSWLRRYDEKSTSAVAEYVDIKRHEVNPIVTLATRRGWSLKKIFRVTWLAMALPIAFGDALLNTYLFFGVPFLAFFFGTFHIVASINNGAYLQRLKRMSKEEIQKEEEENISLGKRFKSSNFKGKLTLLYERDTLAIGMSVLWVFAYSLIYYSVQVVSPLAVESSFFAKGYPVVSFFNMGWIIAFAVLTYFPLKTIGGIIILRRYSKMGDGPASQPPFSGPPGGPYIDLSVGELKEALDWAKKNRSDKVRIHMPDSDPRGDPS